MCPVIRSTVAGPGGTRVPLRDQYGQALAQDWSSRVEFDDLWPRADIGVDGVYLEANEKRCTELIEQSRIDLGPNRRTT